MKRSTATYLRRLMWIIPARCLRVVATVFLIFVLALVMLIGRTDVPEKEQ